MSAATTVIESPLGPIQLAATDEGVCKIVLGDETPQSFADWLARHVGQVTSDPNATVLREAAQQVGAYLRGDLQRFDLPLDLRGTSFQRQVWQAVSGVPYGGTSTYGQIAARIGRPNAARAVGAANGANPLPLVVPCHRIVGSDGALCGYGGGLPIKRALLDMEAGID